MHLIILGAPGSGKGTQAKLICEKFNLNHISSGQLLRAEAQTESAKGKIIAKLIADGTLVPFETIIQVLEPVILHSVNNSGFILDGTPRDLHQAEYLDTFLTDKKISIDKVIYLNIPQEETLKRLLKRAETENRTDDNQETILHRLDIYDQETRPVIEHYQKQGKLLEIDGTPDIQTIFNDIVNKLTLA